MRIGTNDSSASLTNRGADEGIDGVINEDQLGLDIVYLQAKRWENQVGRPEIQKFVGALHGKRARKVCFSPQVHFHATLTTTSRPCLALEAGRGPLTVVGWGDGGRQIWR